MSNVDQIQTQKQLESQKISNSNDNSSISYAKLAEANTEARRPITKLILLKCDTIHKILHRYKLRTCLAGL